MGSLGRWQAGGLSDPHCSMLFLGYPGPGPPPPSGSRRAGVNFCGTRPHLCPVPRGGRAHAI